MKILFYTANGVGLGHLQRTRLIAEEIRSQNKNAKIILITPARTPRIFGNFFDYLIRLTPLSDELLQDSVKARNICLANSQKFARCLKYFKPNLIVVDIAFLSPFTFYAFNFAAEFFPTKSIFIWRLEDIKNSYRNFQKEKRTLNYFQKIIIPHSLRELKDLMPPRFLKQIEANPRLRICNHIFRKLDSVKINFCRREYKIASGDFFITVAFGGGGKLIQAQCEAPNKIIENLFAVYPQLAKAIPNLKIAIITGPYSERIKNKFPSNIRIVKFEKNLPELMNVSNLVISAAGYNICNELIQAQTPGILIPLLRGRGNCEQFERAQYLEKKGIVRVFNGGGSPGKFFNLILGCKKNLNKMKNNFRKFSDWKQGNAAAAKIILNLIKKMI